jgi:prolyl 4-hydroxylase
MVNPDGNLDDLTHHAAQPVIEGEKFFSNLWIWDPVRL